MRKPLRWVMPLSAGLIVGFLLWIIVKPGGADLTADLTSVASTVAAFSAAAACLWAGRRSTGWLRRGWTLIAGGMACTATGDGIWAWYGLVLDAEVPAVSVADIAYLAQIPLTLAGIAAVLATRRASASLRIVLDGLIIAGSFLYLSWAAVLGGAVGGDGATTLEHVVLLAYPVGDVATVSMVFIMLGRVDRSLRPSMSLAGAGLLSLAIADSVYLYVAQTDSYASGDLVDVAWFAAFVLIGAAGVKAALGAGAPVPSRADQPGVAGARTAPASPAGDVLRADRRVTARRSSDRAGTIDPWKLITLPYVPLILALVASIVVQAARGSVGIVLYAISTMLVILVVARQVITLRDNVGLTRRLEATVQDLQMREEQLRRLAFHDPLTGLANRALFHDRVQHAISGQARESMWIGVLFIDLDGFKVINDTRGHAAGDVVLTAVGQRLLGCARPNDTVARLGGDEFAVLVERLDEPESARSLAQRIVDVIGEPIDLGGDVILVGASVGVADHRPGGAGASELLREADFAMYAAKLQGKARCVTFEPHMRSAFFSELRDTGDLSAPRPQAVSA